MTVMTDGLHALAGVRLRQFLMSFTRTPVSGALTGAFCTALLQSSSATTVAAVGFVSAGLMGFGSALGIIFGANLGTTITGWIVALLGFKLKLGTILLPIVLLGTLIRMFASGKAAASGSAIAGFGLIFVGIGLMQSGMAGLEHQVTPDIFPDDSFSGRLQLLGLGVLMTLVTQSSSAGVAAALTALFAGAINFHQAAALVIGMDVGTTVTAVMASIGATPAARRTGLSHVVYNLMTGILALALLDPFVSLWQSFISPNVEHSAQFALVAFHSCFNGLGVMLILPFSNRFARMMLTLIPEPSSMFTAPLDRSLVKVPSVALTCAQTSTNRELAALFGELQLLLSGERPKQLQELQHALDQTHRFIDEIHLRQGQSPDWFRLICLTHCLDHMQRFHERCDEEQGRAVTLSRSKSMAIYTQNMSELIGTLLIACSNSNWSAGETEARKLFLQLDLDRTELRDDVMVALAEGRLSVQQANQQLEAIRWCHRICHHLWRISYHQQQYHKLPE